MRSHQQAIVASLVAAIRGEAEAFARLESRPVGEVIEAAVDHLVLPLLAVLRPSGGSQSSGVTQEIDVRARQELCRDLLREAELKRALAALAGAAVQPLIIKGGQLAYTHYPRPDLRPRVDNDLLIPASTRDAAHEVLTGLGYRRQGGMTGELVSSQSMYVKYIDGAPISALDVHWRIANPQVFARFLEYHELDAQAVSIPALGPGARGLSPPHAMLLACVHRVAHHEDSPRLIWLYDIHLLAEAMTDEEWTRFAALAAERQVVAVCRRSLERTRECFETTVPDEVWGHPAWHDESRRELSAGYLNARRPVSAIVDDLRALPSWRDRWRLAREHLGPSANYMRTVFAPDSRAPLAWLHARRLLRGARKWLLR